MNPTNDPIWPFLIGVGVSAIVGLSTLAYIAALVLNKRLNDQADTLSPLDRSEYDTKS